MKSVRENMPDLLAEIMPVFRDDITSTGLTEQEIDRLEGLDGPEEFEIEDRTMSRNQTKQGLG